MHLARGFRRNSARKTARQILEIRELQSDCRQLNEDIVELKRLHGETASAKDRVVSTFSAPLRRFFGDKYTFDGTAFKVRRNNREMRRGSDRTLSDGEKAGLAFCYFLAQTHLKVNSVEDYGKLYFVFDDPVTSMSFDYVYTIRAACKTLIDSERRKNTQASNDVRARQLVRF